MLLALLSCAPEEPLGFPCELGSATTVSYAAEDMLCVQLDMEAADFDALSHEFRFPGGPDAQFSGVVDHVITSCDEPFPDPYTYFPADLAVDGLAASSVGVRKKGFVGSVLGGSERRPSLKISVDEFVADQLLDDDTERLTLNNNLTDLSRIRSCLSLSVFADAGYPAPRCNLANVMVNGASLGSYTHVEAIKKRFLRWAFGDDEGSLYEVTLSDFTDAHLEHGLGRWEAKTSATDESGALLVAVADALTADDDELEAALDEVLDVDAFLTFWALETLVSHGDGYAANGNNSYVYFDPDNGDRAVFVPWGTDDAMRTDEIGFVRGEVARRLSRHPELSARFLERLTTVTEEVWDEERLLERIDAYDALVGTAEAADGPYVDAVDALRTFVSGRRAQVEAFVADGGVEGEDEPAPCDGLGPIEEFAELGEVLAFYSHGCSSRPGAVGWVWLVALLGLRRRYSAAR